MSTLFFITFQAERFLQSSQIAKLGVVMPIAVSHERESSSAELLVLKGQRVAPI